MSDTTTRRPKRPVFNTALILLSTTAILVGALAWIVVVFFGLGPLPVPGVLVQETPPPVESLPEPMRFTHPLNFGAELSYAILDAAPARHPRVSGATGTIG